MKQDVKKYCGECFVCQHKKASALSLVGLLLPLEVIYTIWIDISMDFIDGLPKATGFDVILVVVDRPSKHFLALKHPYTANSMLKYLLKKS